MSLPPFGWIPAIIVGFTGLIWLLDGCSSFRSRFVCGWAFGFGYFVVGLHWMVYPLLVDAERFGWMVPFSILVLPAVLAVFPAMAALLSGLIARSGWQRIIAFVASWMFMEWLRGHFLSGFPWNLVGYVWIDSLAISQSASVFGIYGLSLITVFISVAPAELNQNHPNRWVLPVLAACLIFGLHMWGIQRVEHQDIKSINNPILRLVQPNISQRDKWKRNLRESNILKHVDLSRRVGFTEVSAVIWPETASTFNLTQDDLAVQLLANAAPPGGVLITGTPRAEKSGINGFRIFNSLVILKNGRIFDELYDKHHLVPFGEFLPLRSWIERIGLDKLAAGAVDISPGKGPRTIRLRGLPAFSPLICFEAIFPGTVVDKFDRPDWLLSISNDAWFGPYAGPTQHFQFSRMRAIEEGLPLIRVANTGVTGAIDAYGRVKRHISMGKEGIIDTQLTSPLPPTVYSQYGDMIALSLGMILLGVASLAQIFQVFRATKS